VMCVHDNKWLYIHKNSDVKSNGNLPELFKHSKKCWVVSTQIWVNYGQIQMLG